MARICVLGQFFVPDNPRMRREVGTLAQAGHQVDVICMRRPGQPRRENDGSVTFHRLPIAHRRDGSAAWYMFEYLAFPLMAALYLTWLDRRRRFDLVQVGSVPDWLVFAAVAPRRRGVPVLLNLFECVPEFFATKFDTDLKHPAVRVLGYLERASIRFSTFSITCTEHMREAFIARGAPADRIGIVMNSAEESVFDVTRYPPLPRHPDRFTLISHGTIEDRYGVDTMIRAVGRLRDRIPELTLEVYGEGSQLPELRQLVEELDVQQHVTFHGFVPIDELVGAIAAADAGVVAMKQDAFRDLTHCNKMFDLITMQRPVICSRTRSVMAYFPNGSLKYFDSDDDADLARAIMDVYRDPHVARRMVRSATLTNEAYRWLHQGRRYLDVIGSLTVGDQGRRALRRVALRSDLPRSSAEPQALLGVGANVERRRMHLSAGQGVV